MNINGIKASKKIFKIFIDKIDVFAIFKDNKTQSIGFKQLTLLQFSGQFRLAANRISAYFRRRSTVKKNTSNEIRLQSLRAM